MLYLVVFAESNIRKNSQDALQKTDNLKTH